MQFREVSCRADDLAALERFYSNVYLADFPDPNERESLENMREYLRLKAKGWYGRNNYHILLGFQNGEPLAGAITDYLAEPNVGVIEFLTVTKGLRGSGLGKQLLEQTEKILAADAQRAAGRDLDCIVAEMNDPFRIDPTHDSLDPFLRASIWDRWGYRKLDFPYVQPALSHGQAPVTGLFLMAKPGRPEFERQIPSTTVKSILRGYMRWAMRIAEPESTTEYQNMSHSIDRAATVPLISLAAYCGRDPSRPLMVREVANTAHPDLDGVLEVYARAFPGGPTDISPDLFRQALAVRSGSAHRYHLWAVRQQYDQPVGGMASFFTFPGAGFGGYIALADELRGKRRFPLLLACIEEQMLRDGQAARGWYIENHPRQAPLFAHHGFYAIDLDYRQPPLPTAAQYAVDDAPPLLLMYKDFGRSYAPPSITLAEFSSTLGDIFRAVYGIEAPEASPFYRDMLAQAARWPNGGVRFR